MLKSQAYEATDYIIIFLDFEIFAYGTTLHYVNKFCYVPKVDIAYECLTLKVTKILRDIARPLFSWDDS